MLRKYLPTLSELIDRLTIAQLKEVFIPDHKQEYAQEIKDICHDINLLLPDSDDIDADFIRSVVVLSQMNLHIWHNESNYRKGIKDGNNLELTHGLNGIRNTAKNKIQEVVGGRKDYKIDCLGQWVTIIFTIAIFYSWYWWLIPIVPFVIYPFAWSGHYFFEKNTPAAFSSPIKAKMCDWLMFKDILLGRISI